MNLRFIIRDGKKILQQQVEIEVINTYLENDIRRVAKIGVQKKWEDVPLVEESSEQQEFIRTPNDSKSMRECETGGEHEWEMDESTGQYFCEICNEAME